jgi:hypothetical protein
MSVVDDGVGEGVGMELLPPPPQPVIPKNAAPRKGAIRRRKCIIQYLTYFQKSIAGSRIVPAANPDLAVSADRTRCIRLPKPFTSIAEPCPIGAANRFDE